jgi:hypothetical protein
MSPPIRRARAAAQPSRSGGRTSFSFFGASARSIAPLGFSHASALVAAVVQLTEGCGWRWEIRPGDGKHKSGVTPISRAAAIKLAEYEIDRVVKDKK